MTSPTDVNEVSALSQQDYGLPPSAKKQRLDEESSGARAAE
jgi:hypothetical protein